ncbi:orotidine 5'-phosphate decarboxylase / HUMPS family protein [Arsenophonus sp.]|uniref:orotidine 5'-phosphate decarboxylase / HUMPS family protein n=1 Tax=Arsenophonus sp. TaxID=1872640 RepID=UPI0028545CD8|nr:orotidine 5'-phosphate decarboxylase / HUMPS family protein [Arsenophonus sp.]MDR5617994.1 orotidine 5'-phosphate decarboxylase / HUMPS family protein [Arsenophonus sp.]
MIASTQNKLPVSTNSPVIVALDYHDLAKALSFVDNLSPQDCRLKVGMQMAKEALVEYGKDAPLLIAVTILTSMEQADLHQIGITQLPADRALQLAKLAKECELDGVVCSAHEVATLKSACGSDFLSITPGIRPIGAEAYDQRRIMTPEQAINVGVDYMVIGRPITHSADPVLTLAQINRSIGWIT